jgi:hypothetical protein
MAYLLRLFVDFLNGLCVTFSWATFCYSPHTSRRLLTDRSWLESPPISPNAPPWLRFRTPKSELPTARDWVNAVVRLRDRAGGVDAEVRVGDRADTTLSRGSLQRDRARRLRIVGLVHGSTAPRNPSALIRREFRLIRSVKPDRPKPTKR